MTNITTKKDLEEVLDKKFEKYQGAVIEAVDFKFQSLEQKMDMRFQEMERRMDAFEKKLDRLVDTLDHFLKRLTDHEDEFIILKTEMNQIKAVIKEKFGVEITACL